MKSGYLYHRPYFPEESPWIEGPMMVKHKGKYYLMYAAIGLEFSSYSHGVYVSDSPLGPFEYSEHNPLTLKLQEVKEVMVVRNPEDRRDATLLWKPVEGADGYVVRYGIEPDKLYNNYLVYDNNTLTIHSLNKDPEYYFKVEAFYSGTDYYRERTEQTMGRGAEIELTIGRDVIERKMIKEKLNEYVFDSITPGEYTFMYTFGPVLWRGELNKAELIGPEDKVTVSDTLASLGKGLEVLGQMEIKVIPGKEFGKIVITLKYDKQ